MESIGECGKSKEAAPAEKLRRWYLARLRAQAFHHGAGFSPAALIDADRKFVEQLISSYAHSYPQTQDKLEEDSSSLLAVPLWLAGLGILFVGLVLQLKGDIVGSLRIMWALSGQLLLPGTWDSASVAGAGIYAALVPAYVLAVPLGILAAPLLLRKNGCSHPAPARVGGAGGWGKQRRLLCPQDAVVICLFLVVFSPIAAAAMLMAQTEQAGSDTYRFLASLFAWQAVLGGCLLFSLRKYILNPIERITVQMMDLLGESGDGSRSASTMERLGVAAQRMMLNREEFARRERLIADFSQDVICCLDAELRLLSANTSFEIISGFSLAEVVGKPISKLLLQDEADKMSHQICQARSGQQPVTVESRLLTRSQHAVDLQWLVEWSQTESCFFAQGRNITDQKMLERARRDFVAMIGHDIKTPLASARVNVECVESGLYGELSQKALTALRETQSSLNHLLLLIDEFLDFEKLAAGKMRLSMTDVDIQSLVAGALAETKGITQSRKIRVVERVPPLAAQADCAKITRVLVNLLSNAVKFSPEGSTVEICAEQRHDCVEIRVQDEGPGVAPEYRQLIFDRYERIEKTSGEGQPGWGLGLAIARAIVEAHGGIIGVESQSGRGSTFWFTIPAAVEKGDE